MQAALLFTITALVFMLFRKNQRDGKNGVRLARFQYLLRRKRSASVGAILKKMILQPTLTRMTLKKAVTEDLVVFGRALSLRKTCQKIQVSRPQFWNYSEQNHYLDIKNILMDFC